MSNVKARGPRAPREQAHHAELTRLLNPDRLATYLQACHGDHDKAFRLYAWNIEVASALWGSVNVLEVALRNALQNELSTYEAGCNSLSTTHL